MDEYMILDVPGLVPMLLDDGARFGYKELFRPSKPVTYASNSNGYSVPMEEGVEIAMGSSIRRSGDFWGTFGGGAVGYSLAAAAGATGFVGAGMVAGMYAGGKTRELGKRRARRHVRKAIEDGSIVDMKCDLSSLEKIIDDMDLKGKITEYDNKIQARKAAQKKKGWFGRNFFMEEDAEIQKYRTCEIAPIFGALKTECGKLTEAVSWQLEEIYAKAEKDLSKEYDNSDTKNLIRTYLGRRFGE
ncbi:MAG: hypothetical protein HZB68_02595 [Candidatus Aenigmarchaeota archaeon]|nr:hypothetical protein [Candidatus Aenigmarchaeota archaeon]